MKKELIAVLVTIVGGVAIYWFTTGLENQRQRNEQRQETQRQQENERRHEEELAKQRQEEQERVEAERQRQAAEDKAKQPKMSVLEMDINRNGSDYKDFVASDINECLSACAGELKCVAITFTKSSRQCWMKSSVPLRTDDTRYISAVKVGG